MSMLKKALARPSTVSVSRTVASLPNTMAVLGTATWIGDTTPFSSGSSVRYSRAIWPFSWPHWAVTGTACRAHNAHTVELLGSFPYFRVSSQELSAVVVNWLRVGLASQYWFACLYSEVKSPVEVYKVWPCKMSVPSMFSELKKWRPQVSGSGGAQFAEQGGLFWPWQSGLRSCL